jgi:TPR repeat protein
MYAEGEVGAPDSKAAGAWYRKAADLGALEGLWNLAFLMVRGLGEAGSAEEGLSILFKSAEGGDPTAAFALHSLFASGQYLPRDTAKADLWLKSAAENGSEAAAFEAPGGSKRVRAARSIPEAAEYLRRASDGGSSAAQSILGRLLYEGMLLMKVSAPP